MEAANGGVQTGAYPCILFKSTVAPLGSSLSQRQTLTKPNFISVFRAIPAVPGDPGQGKGRTRHVQ